MIQVSSDEMCVFYDDATVAMIRIATSTFTPGDIVTLRANTLRLRSDFDICGFRRQNNASTVTLLAPSNPIEPMTIVAVPHGPCASPLDASASIGFRPLEFRWSINGTNSTSAIVQNPGTSFNLTIIDFFGAEANFNSVVDVVDEAIPDLTIPGGLAQTIRASSPLSIFADARVCRASSLALTYVWNATSSNGKHLSTSVDPRYFELPAYTLSAETRLFLHVRVTDASGLTNEATLTVDVLQGNVIASIDGTRGSERSAVAGTQLTLDASTSYDEDDPTAALNFSWSCLYFETTADQEGTSCGSNESSAAFIAMTPPGTTVGSIFEWTVLATASDGRNDTAVARVLVVEKITVTIRADAERLDKVNPSRRLVLIADVDSNTNGTTHVIWSRTNDEPLNLDVDSPVTRTLTGTSVPLVIRADALVAGASYSFALTATSGSSTSVATIEVTCNVAPTSGSLTVSPTSGEALTTLFALRADGWIDADLPLRYSFFQRAPVNATRSLIAGDLVVPHYEGAYFAATGNQTNAVIVAVSDVFDATTTEETVVDLRAKNFATIAGLANLTLPLLANALESGDVDLAYQVLTASADAIDAWRGSANTSTAMACDLDGGCESTAVEELSVYREALLTTFASVIDVQADSVETRARQSKLLSALTTSSSETPRTKLLALDLALDLASRAATGGFQTDSSRDETTAHVATALSNLHVSGLLAINNNTESSFLTAIDDVACGLLAGAVLGQNAESVVAPTLGLTTVVATDAVDIVSELSASVSVPASLFAAGGALGLGVVDFSHDIHPSSGAETTSTVRFVVCDGNDDSPPSRRLTSSDDELRVVLRRGGFVVNATTHGYNLTVLCEEDYVGNKTVQCNGTDVVESIKCNGTASLYRVRCETRTDLACAEYQNETWVMRDSLVVAASDGNVTCSYVVSGDLSSRRRDLSATSHSAVEYFVSALAFGVTRPGEVLSEPLLIWTFSVMLVSTGVLAIVGSVLDLKDARRFAKVLAGVETEREPKNLQVRAIAAASLPIFVREIRDNHIIGHALRLIWRNHSVLTILTRYKPTQPRRRRALLLLFSLLFIMLSQICALWVAFPIGYCEVAESREDCEAKRTLYDEVLQKAFGIQADGKSCEWLLDECQLEVPSSRDIGTKRVALVFIVFALSLPCLAIVEACFVKYVCAPIHAAWAGPRVLAILSCLFTVVEKSTEDSTKVPDSDDDSSFGGGAPPTAENDDSDAPGVKQKLPAIHLVGLRLWRNLGIHGGEPQCRNQDFDTPRLNFLL